MTEFQRTNDEVVRLSSELAGLAAQLANDPTNQYEEMSRYCSMLDRMEKLEAQLAPESELTTRIGLLLSKAEESNPLKRLYNDGTKQKVQDLASLFAALPEQLENIKVVLEATHQTWEAERERERVEAEVSKHAARQVELAREREEEQRREAAKKEAVLKQQQRDQQERVLQEAAEEQLNSGSSAAAAKRKRQKEKKKAQRQRDREEREERDQNESIERLAAAKASAGPESSEDEDVKRPQQNRREKRNAARIPSPETAQARPPLETEPEAPPKPQETPAHHTARLTMTTLPGPVYSRDYSVKSIANSPKVELHPVDGSTEWLVVYRLVVLCRPTASHQMATFQYSTPVPAAPPEEEQDDQESSGSSGEDEVVIAEDAGNEAEAEAGADYAKLAAFLTSEWERKQVEEQEELSRRSLPAVLGLDWMRQPSSTNWTIMLSHGGYFAGACYVNGKPVVHKTFHRYVVRKKQGGRQSTHDKSGGSMTSVGSQLRRHHERKYREQIQSTMRDWAAHLHSSTAILTHAPGPLNFGVFFFDDAILAKGDPRLYSIPLPLVRPTFDEVKKAYEQLTTVLLCTAK